MREKLPEVDHKDIRNLKDSIESLRGAIDRLDNAITSFPQTFVTKTELELMIQNINLKINPLEKLAYRGISIVLTAVVIAILALVITR